MILLQKSRCKGLCDGETGKGQNQRSSLTQAKKSNKEQAGIQSPVTGKRSNTQVRQAETGSRYRFQVNRIQVLKLENQDMKHMVT